MWDGLQKNARGYAIIIVRSLPEGRRGPAGGAMAAVLLAAYPEVFAAGAVVAGLPVSSASGVGSAVARMAEAGADLDGSRKTLRALITRQ